MSTDVSVIEGSPSHLFKKGVSGNPAGRPKGSKNAVTLVKLAIEGELREQMKADMSDILTKGLKMAKDGNEDMIKYFLDKWITPARASSDDEPPRERVQIVIGRLPDETPVRGRIIQHDPKPE